MPMSKKKTVVVVDDETDLLRYIRRVLEDAGYEVHTSSNGLEGIQLIRRVEPDVVILDILMPVLQGYEVCRYLRNQWELEKMRIIFLSSLAAESDKKWGMDAGADAYLTKPVGVNELVEAVRNVLAQKKTRALT
jgi:DNA-binding response OmpR family regulator